MHFLTSEHQGLSVLLYSAVHKALGHEMACRWAVVMSLQVLIGGGQDAADVTTTSDRAGGFQSRFFHKVSPTHRIGLPRSLDVAEPIRGAVAWHIPAALLRREWPRYCDQRKTRIHRVGV